LNEDYQFNVKRKRPEDLYSSVFDYYDDETRAWYASSKSIVKTQEKITIRVLELLELDKENSLILDCGCGPGFSSIYLHELGYRTVALDIINEFFSYYSINELNPITADMCFPPFKDNSFDAIISISAFQWIYTNLQDKKMEHNLVNLIKSFHSILKPKSKVVIQFYPKNRALMARIGNLIAKSSEFDGHYIIDNPDNPKKRKVYLILEKLH